MPVVIEEMSTTLELKDEAKIRELVQEEIKKALAGHGAGRLTAGEELDPADPGAGGVEKR